MTRGAEPTWTVADASVRHPARAGRRMRTLRFESPAGQLLVTVVDARSGVRIDGWLAPPEPAVVEVRGPTGPSLARTTADEAGRFVLNDVPGGPAHLVLHRAEGTTLTPVVRL